MADIRSPCLPAKSVVTVLILAMVMAVPAAWAAAEETAAAKAHLESLRRLARISLIRVKNAVEKDGYYSARAMLNAWRLVAKEAGTFDPQLYEEIKFSIYDKSARKNLAWCENYLQQKKYYEANVCLQLWRIHSKEIGTFDPEVYKFYKKSIR